MNESGVVVQVGGSARTLAVLHDAAVLGRRQR